MTDPFRMRAGTLFSGIGCAELATPEIDWRWCAESDPEAKSGHGFAAEVHRVRHGIENLHDVKTVDWHEVARREPVDALVFGSPCQSFSVAGRRLGLDDPRGNLALVALGVARILRPRWLVFENVPGLLSIDSGEAMGAFLWEVGQLGYGWAYRVLDARYFGVPQRRRRVFLVGHLGDWRRAAAVLFEPASLRRDSATGREARPAIAGEVEAAARGGGERIAGTVPAGGAVDRGLTGQDLRAGLYAECAPPVLASDGKRGKSRHEGAALVEAWGGNNTAGPIDVATAVRAHRGPHGHQDFESETFIADVADPLTAHERDAYTHEGAGNFRLRNVVEGGPIPVAEIGKRASAGAMTKKAGDGFGRSGDPSFTLGADSRHGVILLDPTQITHPENRSRPEPGARLRRLTPRECERLQGLPDDFTAVPWRGRRVAKDGPRYRAIGNGMAIPVMRWILTRLRREHER